MEVWRGGVSAWECDEMGHLNVRFHVSRAMEGLGVLAELLGLEPVFAADTTATLAVREHHIRFLREVRAGEALHMTAGILSLDEGGLQVLQILRHSFSGEICACFVTRAAYVARDGRALCLPQAASARAGGMRVSLPPEAAPRGVTGAALASAAGGDRADALGMAVTGHGLVGWTDCDAFGCMRPEMVIARINLGLPHLLRPIRDAMETKMDLPGRIGGAALEYRILYLCPAAAGTPVLLRSGLAALQGKAMRLNHWLLDARTGVALASAEHVSVNFDLKTRKSLDMPSDLQAQFQAHVISGMSL